MPRKELIITSSVLILVTCTLTLLLVTQVFPAGQTSVTLSSTGSIQTTEGIGVYSNFACTAPKTTIEWGSLEKGGNSNVVIYVKNEGDSPLTLSFMASDWTPSNAPEFLSISWDYDNQPLSPGDSVQITFTLSVDPDIQGISTFGLNLYLIGNL